MKSINIFHLSYFIIEYFNKKELSLTHLKLQKLLYYIKSWGLVSGEVYVEGNFKAWKNGPVNDEIYEYYKKYGAGNIPVKKSAFALNNEKAEEVIKFVIESYEPYQAYTLSAMTHAETPWKVTPANEVIDEKLINNYYKTQPFAKNFPLLKGNLYYPVYTDFIASFVMDMNENDPASDIHFSSFEEYKNYLSEAQPHLDKLIQKFAG